MRIVGVAVCVATLGVILAYNFSKTDHGPKAEYGEVPDLVKTVVLRPGQWMHFGPSVPAGGHLRYDVKSFLPVNAGAVKEGFNWPQDVTCYDQQIVNSSQDCRVEPTAHQFVNIQDVRPGGFMLPADNTVTVTIYRWDCVKNCRK